MRNNNYDDDDDDNGPTDVRIGSEELRYTRQIGKGYELGNGGNGGDARWFNDLAICTTCTSTPLRENVNQMSLNRAYLLLLATTPAMGKGLAAPTSVDCLTILSNCIAGLVQPQGVVKRELLRSETAELARAAVQPLKSAEDVVIQPRACEDQAPSTSSFSTRATRGDGVSS